MSQQFDVVVIGGGPGGYVAAIRAAQLGFNTACVDSFKNPEGQPSLGGTCLNVGCIPSKALLQSSENLHAVQHDFAAHGISVNGASMDVGTMLKRKEGIIGKNAAGIAFLFKKNKVANVHGLGTLKARQNEKWVIEVTDNGAVVDTLEQGGRGGIADHAGIVRRSGCADQARRRGQGGAGGCLPAAGNKKGSLRCLSRCLAEFCRDRPGRCGFRLRCGSARALDVAVLLAEALDAAGGVDDLLLAGVEGVAGRAHFDVVLGLAHGRARHEGVAARAGDADVGVLGMDVRFHGGFLNLAGGGCDRPVS